MRVQQSVASHRKHKKIRKNTKGMSHGNRVSVRRGKQALTRALQYAYRDRRNRKRTFRSLWNVRINAAARLHGTTYSKLIPALKSAKIELDRRSLAELAAREPDAFAAVVKASVKK